MVIFWLYIKIQKKKEKKNSKQLTNQLSKLLFIMMINQQTLNMFK